MTRPSTPGAPGPPHPFAGRLHHGDVAEAMRAWPDGTADLVVASPPRWSAVRYDGAPPAWASYDAYLADMARAWAECARLLRPNGKPCVNAPLMPIPKAAIPQHARHLKNIAADLEAGILAGTGLLRYGMFVWQKQTSRLMFGSHPHPGDIIENDTVEFINVHVRPGPPPRFSPSVRAANRIPRGEWLDLAQQVWPMHPADARRARGHPAPFPERLPARLIRPCMHGAADGFPGEVVLDPFAGTGTACAAARRMGRRRAGIDPSARYLEAAAACIAEDLPPPPLLVGRPSYPGRAELAALALRDAGTAGAAAAAKHRRASYGRGAGPGQDGGRAPDRDGAPPARPDPSPG